MFEACGLGKTIEAGLVLREMLLRRRVDYVVVAAPAAMTAQWQDELAQKFGLNFTIVDREYLANVRRAHGFAANPWNVGSRFIVSHSLLGDETYSDGLKDVLEGFRPRSLFILDEAHHAAPASGQAYATDSQFTRAVRGLADRFEHRLLLSATPHNGHSNSFSSLLEILDQQRFTRGVPVEPDLLEHVMERRLKSDLVKLGADKFPKRDIEPIVLQGLPKDSPELVLAEALQAYRAWCETGLQGSALSRAAFVFSGLQQRLLSSIPAFARTHYVWDTTKASKLIESARNAFKKACQITRSMFGPHAFKRYYRGQSATDVQGRWEPKKFNASLYDIVMYTFAREDKNIIFRHLDAVREGLIHLMTEDQKFIDAIELSTSSVQAVTTRFDKWRLELQSIIGTATTEPRCFSRELKEALFKANSTCPLCGSRIIDVDDAAVDHIDQYWKGGKTIPENARLTHRYCNCARPRTE
jgi:hypothetical protein